MHYSFVFPIAQGIKENFSSSPLATANVAGVRGVEQSGEKKRADHRPHICRKANNGTKRKGQEEAQTSWLQTMKNLQ